MTQTHENAADRIERLILILLISLYFAVSTAMQPDENEPVYAPKKHINV